MGSTDMHRNQHNNELLRVALYVCKILLLLNMSGYLIYPKQMRSGTNLEKSFSRLDYSGDLVVG